MIGAPSNPTSATNWPAQPFNAKLFTKTATAAQTQGAHECSKH